MLPKFTMWGIYIYTKDAKAAWHVREVRNSDAGHGDSKEPNLRKVEIFESLLKGEEWGARASVSGNR